MMEILKANSDELNQLSKQFLKEIGQYPDPSLLYCLQLGKWGIESGKLEVRYPALLENLESFLYQWNPDEAMKFLTVNDSGDEEDILSYLGSDEPSPLNLAIVILEQLNSRLTATLPGYPKPRDLPANFR
ncbi:MAG: hypothetical protein JRJ85_09520 [Deltaproteobacteria bacterium]|nr:hypothetical protein [Deltaproteobacteria bacterium]